MSKVTIEDISQHTGLSRGTVSRALNNRPDISQQTKQRVLEACRQLNYVPSHAARSLATGRSFAAAVVVSDFDDSFGWRFVRGVSARSLEDRYAVQVAELGNDVEAAVEALSWIAHERVDTLLLATPLATPLVAKLQERISGRPLVAFSAPDGVACDVMMPDYAEAARLAAQHLVRRGQRDVLYVHADRDSFAGTRREAFAEALRHNEIDPSDAIVDVGPGTGSERMDPVRSRLQDVAAVVASDDALAVEVATLCAGAGRQAGRDIAIMGQGGDVWAAMAMPGLTTIDYCAAEIGRRAMDLALQRVTHARQDAPQTVLVAPNLVVRASTGCR